MTMAKQVKVNVNGEAIYIYIYISIFLDNEGWQICDYVKSTFEHRGGRVFTWGIVPESDDSR